MTSNSMSPSCHGCDRQDFKTAVTEHCSLMVSLTLLCILTLFSHDGNLKCENCILKK